MYMEDFEILMLKILYKSAKFKGGGMNSYCSVGSMRR